MSLLREIINNSGNISKQEYQSFLESQFQENNKNRLIALLAALSAKPLTLDDIVNFVEFIEQKTQRRYLSFSDQAVNIVGTGGGISTFNISTTSAFVAAAAGAAVIKSGSYSYNSQCGSLDVLNNLGIKLPGSEHALQSMVEELNIGFVNPNMYSPLLRRLAVSILPLNLREIGGFINTIGPLLCPFHVHGQICGVRSYHFVQLFSKALWQLDLRNTVTVWSEIGLDEFSAIGINHLAFVNSEIRHQTFNPLDYDMVHSDESELDGGSPEINAAIVRKLLQTGHPNAARDTVIVNAAHLLLVSGQTDSIVEAIQMCQDAIRSQAAYRLLNQVIEFSHDYPRQEPESCQIGKTG